MPRHNPIRRALPSILLVLGPLATPRAAIAQGKPTPPPPPCTAAEYHQFDFWLGDWSVTTPDGKSAGTNLITRPLGDCVLQEHWVGSRGGRGESFNVYDAARGLWHQTWVDDSGTLLLLEGRFEGGKMVLSGEQVTKAGSVLNRITWSPVHPGEVQQLWESSSDGGSTWSQLFLGIYRPRKK